MAWQPIGPNTWKQGRFRLYKSQTPAAVYWLSVDGGDPIRCTDREKVQAHIRKVMDAC